METLGFRTRIAPTRRRIFLRSKPHPSASIGRGNEALLFRKLCILTGLSRASLTKPWSQRAIPLEVEAAEGARVHQEGRSKGGRRQVVR